MWSGLFALASVVWFSGMAIGYFIVDWTSRMPIDMALADIVRGADGVDLGKAEKATPVVRESPLDLFVFFLGRNFAVYVCLLAGLLSAGAITFLVLLANGILLGQAIGFAVWSGLPVGALADLLLPHGVLEVGTFFIAGAVGFQGFALAMRRSRQNWESIKALRLGLVLGYGLGALAVAAAVEAVVTAELAHTHWSR